MSTLKRKIERIMLNYLDGSNYMEILEKITTENIDTINLILHEYEKKFETITENEDVNKYDDFYCNKIFEIIEKELFKNNVKNHLNRLQNKKTFKNDIEKEVVKRKIQIDIDFLNNKISRIERKKALNHLNNYMEDGHE